jgi:hypothetical protein
VLGYGSELTIALSTTGEHTLSLYARGAYGFTAGTAIRITVEESPPAPPAVASITIDPEEAGLMWTEDSVRFSARAFDASGTEISGVIIDWTSTDPEVAMVDAGGLATVHGQGVTEIRASVGGVSATATLSAGPPSVAIQSPQYGSGHTEGDTIDFIGSAVSIDGVELPDSALVWISRGDTIGTGRHVRSAALPAGMHTIELHATDRFGRTAVDHNNIDIYPRREVAYITILPEAEHVEVGDTVRLTALAYDSAGSEIPDAVLAWSSSAPHIATVDREGVVTGVAPSAEPIRITAAVGDVEATVPVTV